MRMMARAAILPFMLLMVLSGAVFCADAVTSEVLLNGKALTGANYAVLFAKLNKVVVVNAGESAKQKKFELYGRVEFKNNNEVFDAFYANGGKFTMTYRTQTTLEAQSVTFKGCKVYKKDKAAGLVTYRIKADELQ